MKKSSYKILPDKDLSETQIYTTMETYDRFAKEYAEKWEWNPKTVYEIKKYNIKPFLKYAKKGGAVSLLSCQTGRDYSLLRRAGFSCLGVEFSYGLLTEAVKRVPGGLFIHMGPRSFLPFVSESFDAIYADDLNFAPKKDIKNLLRDFRIFLKPYGILYLSLKLGKGNICLVENLGGKRYMTLFQKSEILELVKSAGLSLLWSKESEDTDPTIPKWFSLIAQKP